MNCYRRKSLKQQSGQLLIHLAEIFVSAGLIVGAALQGDVYFENYQFQTAYEDLRSIENAVWAFQEKNELWPSECGVLSIKPSRGELTKALCQHESDNLIQSINGAIKKNSETAGWGREFEIQSINTPSAGIKHAIILKNVNPQLAEWLDLRIDGHQSLPSGRIISGEFIPSLTSNDLVYLFESRI